MNPQVMIDANVLRHALRAATGAVAEGKEGLKDRACYELLDCLPSPIAISSVAWFEVLRSVSDNQGRALARYQGRFVIVPEDRRSATLAAEVFRKMHKKGSLCSGCWGMKPPHCCPKCGNQRSKDPRRNDILIAATAAAMGIKTLYSYDTGMPVICNLLPQTAAVEPPPPTPKQMELTDGKS